MRTAGCTVVIAVIGSLLVSSGWTQNQPTREEQIKAYFEMLRKDLRTERQSMVDQAMRLEAGDKAKFWTVYEKYQAEMRTLVDQRIANAKKYVDNVQNMTDLVADEIATKSLDLESQRTAVRKKYYGQIKTVLGGRIAARFLQTEVLLDDLFELQVAPQILQ